MSGLHYKPYLSKAKQCMGLKFKEGETSPLLL